MSEHAIELTVLVAHHGKPDKPKLPNHGAPHRVTHPNQLTEGSTNTKDWHMVDVFDAYVHEHFDSDNELDNDDGIPFVTRSHANKRTHATAYWRSQMRRGYEYVATLAHSLAQYADERVCDLRGRE